MVGEDLPIAMAHPYAPNEAAAAAAVQEDTSYPYPKLLPRNLGVHDPMRLAEAFPSPDVHLYLYLGDHGLFHTYHHTTHASLRIYGRRV